MKPFALLLLTLPLWASPIQVSGYGSFGCDPEGSDYSVSFAGDGVSLTANSIYSLGCPFSVLGSSLSGLVHGNGEAEIDGVASSWFGFNLGLAGAYLTLFDQQNRVITRADLGGYIEIADYHASPVLRESYGTFVVSDGHDDHGSVPEPSYFWIGALWLCAILCYRESRKSKLGRNIKSAVWI